MNMKRAELFAILGLVFAMSAGPALPQQDAANRSAGDLKLTVTLEDASQPGAAARNLALPLDERARTSPSPSEQGHGFQPANFASPNRLEALQIDADDLPDRRPTVAVRCQAFIGRDGSLGEYFCISDDSYADRAVVSAVIMTVPTQRFVAARVDSENVRVLMNFAAYVDCSSGSCFVVAARNHGYHAEKLGLDYVDPQPILEADDWYDGFDHKLQWVRGWMPNVTNRRFDSPQVHYVMAAEIDSTGAAGAGCLYWLDRDFTGPAGRAVAARPLHMVPPRTKTDLVRAIASLGNVRYVPGMVDGRPATLRLYEQSVVSAQLAIPSNASATDRSAVFNVLDIQCE
jgi:hypothetical protein